MLLQSTAPLHGHIYLCVCLSVDRHLGLFRAWAITYNAAVNTQVKFLCERIFIQSGCDRHQQIKTTCLPSKERSGFRLQKWRGVEGGLRDRTSHRSTSFPRFWEWILEATLGKLLQTPHQHILGTERPWFHHIPELKAYSARGVVLESVLSLVRPASLCLRGSGACRQKWGNEWGSLWPRGFHKCLRVCVKDSDVLGKEKDSVFPPIGSVHHTFLKLPGSWFQQGLTDNRLHGG